MDCAIKGSHPVIRVIVAAAERLAHRPTPILIIGEPGTGRELLARHVHRCGNLPDASFVRIGPGEASAARLENAVVRAGGGTLFVDDLSGLSPDLQEVLLDALQRATMPSPRLIASSALDAAEGRRQGRLSAALLRHLDPVELAVPALRQRRADIPVLVEHFLRTYVDRHVLPPCRIEGEALVQLWGYDWPGNVRELESVIERVAVLCRSGVVRRADLPATLRDGGQFGGPTGPQAPRAAATNGGPTLRQMH